MIKKYIEKYKSILNISILIIYSCIVLYAVFYHELWRDEAQAWTIARDLSIIDIFKQMQWEGHPCLWHLILMPFAKLGFPPITISFISFVFMFATAGMILYKSPFHLFVKIALIFSSPFLYFYSINSRVYALVPFLLSLLCVFYPKRFDRPYLYALLLAFLINTHIILAAFAGIVALLFFIETVCNKNIKDKKCYILSCFIIVIGILILYLQISHSLQNNSIYTNIQDNYGYYDENKFKNFMYILLHGFIAEVEAFSGIGTFDLTTIYILIVCLVLLILLGLIFSFKYTIIVFISYLFILLIHSFIWFSITQRTLMIIFYVMVATWLLYEDIKNKHRLKKFYVWQFALFIISCISIPYGYNSYSYDIDNAVSGAKATASYIENELENATFICPVDYVATTVTGYIDRNIFYSNIRREYFTFATWDEFWRKNISYDEFIEGIHLYSETNDNVYLLFSEYFVFSYDQYIYELCDKGWLVPIYESPKGLNDESYVIYKITDEFKYNLNGS